MTAATDGQRDWDRRQNGRQPGEGRGRPRRLTPRERDDIVRRLAEGERAQDLAVEYGVSTSLIQQHRP